MYAVQFDDLIKLRLTQDLLEADSLMRVQDASDMPTLGEGDWTYLTVTAGSKTETVRVTAIMGNALTIERTDAQTFLLTEDPHVEMRWCTRMARDWINQVLYFDPQPDGTELIYVVDTDGEHHLIGQIDENGELDNLAERAEAAAILAEQEANRAAQEADRGQVYRQESEGLRDQSADNVAASSDEADRSSSEADRAELARDQAQQETLPPTAGQEGKLLSNDGTDLQWVEPPNQDQGSGGGDIVAQGYGFNLMPQNVWHQSQVDDWDSNDAIKPSQPDVQTAVTVHGFSAFIKRQYNEPEGSPLSRLLDTAVPYVWGQFSDGRVFMYRYRGAGFAGYAHGINSMASPFSGDHVLVAAATPSEHQDNERGTRRAYYYGELMGAPQLVWIADDGSATDISLGFDFPTRGNILQLTSNTLDRAIRDVDNGSNSATFAYTVNGILTRWRNSDAAWIDLVHPQAGQLATMTYTSSTDQLWLSYANNKLAVADYNGDNFVEYDVPFSNKTIWSRHDGSLLWAIGDGEAEPRHWFSTDGGATWEELEQITFGLTPSSIFYPFMAPLDNILILAEPDAHRVHYSADGLNWHYYQVAQLFAPTSGINATVLRAMEKDSAEGMYALCSSDDPQQAYGIRQTMLAPFEI